MINVIVFSKQGNRPTFNQLSGEDLDGDSYFISYNGDITNNIKDTNCKPLEDLKYTEKTNKIIKKGKITIKDSANCMIKTTLNNVIGQIYDNHLSFADESLFKAKGPKCIKLCKYFNQEIYASKTENFNDLPNLKNENLIKKKSPDFLSNGMVNKNKTYESPGILGALYRKIDQKKLYDYFRNNFLKRQLKEIIR